MLERQPYRLAYWRVAADEINYRRFFDINDLAGLRTQNFDVLEATHRKVLEWTAEGRIHGWRIDHPDGLYDPRGYLEWLRARLGEIGRPELYIVVEKILAAHEHLPRGWPVQGTTGYDFAGAVNGVFVFGCRGRRLRPRLSRIHARDANRSTRCSTSASSRSSRSTSRASSLCSRISCTAWPSRGSRRATSP